MIISPSHSPLFLSFVSQLKNLDGHFYNYHKGVQEAVTSIGMNFKAALSESAVLPQDEPGWIRSLRLSNPSEINTSPPLCTIYKRRAIRSIHSMFDRCEALSHQTLLYNEVYFPDFFFLAEALLSFPSEKLKNITLWLLYREPPNFLSVHRARLLQMHRQLESHLKGRFRLFSEGDRQCQILGEYFDRDVSALPIPHGFQVPLESKKFSELPLCVCYGPARPGYFPLRKGADLLQRILDKRLYGNSPPFALAVADDSELCPQPDGIPLYLFSSKLNREDYYKWISRADLAIFPYQQDHYDYYPSSIFIEV
ncbi:MAG: hypothetical protein KDK40_05890, partial [Chlamydiia bacterium]|nr:hypothetical protein [Chlamydiia bacterium]